MRALWHILGRWHEVRASRAMRRYLAHKDKAEEFFARTGWLP